LFDTVVNTMFTVMAKNLLQYRDTLKLMKGSREMQSNFSRKIETHYDLVDRGGFRKRWLLAVGYN